MTTDIAAGNDEATQVQPDGRILAVGFVTTGAYANFASSATTAKAPSTLASTATAR